MIATHFSPLFLLALPSGGDHRHSLDEIFEYKLPKLKEGDSDKYLIGAELIVLLKWLIYTAPFKDVNVEPRGQIHAKFYQEWRATIRAAEKTMRKKLKAQLDIWYAKHPPKRKRGASKGSAGKADDSDEERGCQRRKVYHDFVDTVRFHLMCERLHFDDSVVTHSRTVARACTRKEKLTKGPILPGGRTPL